MANNFSSDLRRTVLDVKLTESYRSKILSSFGEHISVFTPESLSEYEALSKLIELTLSGFSNDKVINFIEAHAKDIYQYATPDKYLAAFAHQDEEIQKLLPNFYSELRTKRAFKEEKKNIAKALRAERKAAERNQKSLNNASTASNVDGKEPEAETPQYDDK